MFDTSNENEQTSSMLGEGLCFVSETPEKKESYDKTTSLMLFENGSDAVIPESPYHVVEKHPKEFDTELDRPKKKLFQSVEVIQNDVDYQLNEQHKDCGFPNSIKTRLSVDDDNIGEVIIIPDTPPHKRKIFFKKTRRT